MYNSINRCQLGYSDSVFIYNYCAIVKGTDVSIVLLL